MTEFCILGGGINKYQYDTQAHTPPSTTHALDNFNTDEDEASNNRDVLLKEVVENTMN